MVAAVSSFGQGLMSSTVRSLCQGLNQAVETGASLRSAGNPRYPRCVPKSAPPMRIKSVPADPVDVAIPESDHDGQPLQAETCVGGVETQQPSVVGEEVNNNQEAEENAIPVPEGPPDGGPNGGSYGGG